MSDFIAAYNIAARVEVNLPIEARFFIPKGGSSYKSQEVKPMVLKQAIGFNRW